MKTFDEIMCYPYQARKLLIKNPTIAKLLLNEYITDISDENVEQRLRNCVFDYSFVEDIIQDTKSFICVDIEFPWQETDTVTAAQLVILIGVSRSIIELDHGLFKGMIGNRLANLFVEVNSTITESELGIGSQHLQTGKSYVVSKDFSCKQLVYHIPNI